MSNPNNWPEACIEKFTKIYNIAKRTGKLHLGRPTYPEILKALENYPNLKSRFLALPVGPYRQNRIYIALGTLVLETCASRGCENKCMPNATYCSAKCSSNEKSVRNKYKKTCRSRYGVNNTFNSKAAKRKIKETNLSRYGAEHPSQSPELQAKKIRTYIKRFGVDHPWKLREIREKAEQTYLENYGVDNPSKDSGVKKKKQDTCMLNYGVKHPGQSKVVRKRSVRTNRKRYGADNPMQNPKVAEHCQRQAFRTKSYVLGSRIVDVQGFEPQALDYIIAKGVSPRRILVSSDAGFRTFKYALDGAGHVYIPDIQIRRKHKPLIVEVKSTYTFVGTKRMFRTTQEKAKAVVSAGFEYRLLLMARDGCRINVPHGWLDMSYSKVRSTVLLE